MQWVLWMIAVAVLGLAAVGASGRLGELPGTVTDTPRPHVPTGLLSGDDLRGLRFAVVPRGYSMDQVDELLDRLARQLDAANRHVPVQTHPAEAADEPGPAGQSPAEGADGSVPPSGHSADTADHVPPSRENPAEAADGSAPVDTNPVRTAQDVPLEHNPAEPLDDAVADDQPSPAGGSDGDSGHQAKASGIMGGVSSQPERG